MGDGGDGGDADAIAEMPVDFGSEIVIEVAGDPGRDPGSDDFVAPIPPGVDSGTTPRERLEDEIIELTWVEPDTHSGS